MVALGRLLALQVAQSVRFRMCFEGKAIGLMGRVGWGCGGEEKKNEGNYEAAAWVDGGAMH